MRWFKRKNKKYEPLLGGPDFRPATDDDKEDFKHLIKRVPNLSHDEWNLLQRIEWGLTKTEYIQLKMDAFS